MFIKFAALDTRSSRCDGPARQGYVSKKFLKFGSTGDRWLPVLCAEFNQPAAGDFLPRYLEEQIAYEGAFGRVYDVKAVNDDQGKELNNG